MENTYSEYQEWAKTIPDGLVDTKTVEWSYKKALDLLEIYKPFEEKIMAAATSELGDIYKEYIKVTQKDPSTVICLYERSLVDLCLSPEIWDNYCKFLFNLGEVAIKTSSKALRNCPWSEDLWIIRLRILEKQCKDETDILSCFEQGLNSISPPSFGLELWLTYLEYIHRNNTDLNKVDKLFSQAVQQLGVENDPSKVSKWHARILAKRGDMQGARKIWNHIMSPKANKGKNV